MIEKQNSRQEVIWHHRSLLPIKKKGDLEKKKIKKKTRTPSLLFLI
jgi:hypothetical protein